MSTFTTTRLIHAAPERVFDAFTDFHNAADTVRAIKKLEVLTEGPVGVGTRFRETRVMFKREATEEMEVTTFERPKQVVLGCDSCGSTFTTTFDFKPEGDGTRVDVRFEAKPQTFFAKLMSPIGKLMMGSCMKQFEADMDDMAKVAEGRTESRDEALATS